MTVLRWVTAVLSFVAAALNGYCAVTYDPWFWVAAVLFFACSAMWAWMAVEFE